MDDLTELSGQFGGRGDDFKYHGAQMTPEHFELLTAADIHTGKRPPEDIFNGAFHRGPLAPAGLVRTLTRMRPEYKI